MLLKTAHQETQSDVTDPTPKNGYQESFVLKYQQEPSVEKKYESYYCTSELW